MMIYGSVCSGIEAATVAWHPLGWRPSFFSEIAMFLPLAYLSSAGRKRRLWDKTPLKAVYVFSYRVESKRNGTDNGKGGGGMMNFAWYVWENGYKGEPVIRWI